MDGPDNNPRALVFQLLRGLLRGDPDSELDDIRSGDPGSAMF